MGSSYYKSLIAALIIIVILSLSTGAGEKNFISGFKSIPPGGVVVVGSGTSGPEKLIKGQNIERVFTWENIKKHKVQTRFLINQDQLKSEIKNFGIKREMKNPNYITRQGFRLTREGYLIDYRGIFHRNKTSFIPLAEALFKSAQIKKVTDVLPNFLKFIQLIEYKIPPKFFQGRYFHEFFPPLLCLVQKYGDCDTKSILLANFLHGISKKNELLGLVVLRGYGIFHAVLAIQRKPLPGMMTFYINNIGPFIPLETTRSGWMPGFADRRVVFCLKKGMFRFDRLNW